MRKHNLMRQVTLPVGNGFGEVPAWLLDVSALRVRADHHGQPILRKVPQQS
jgi:hypothetical protein